MYVNKEENNPNFTLKKLRQNKYLSKLIKYISLVKNSADRDSVNDISLRTTERLKTFALLLIFGQFKSEHQV